MTASEALEMHDLALGCVIGRSPRRMHWLFIKARVLADCSAEAHVYFPSVRRHSLLAIVAGVPLSGFPLSRIVDEISIDFFVVVLHINDAMVEPGDPGQTDEQTSRVILGTTNLF